MPRVQAYGGPRVETKPLPTVRHSIAESAAAVTAAGLREIGSDISTMAYRQGMVMATAERQRADETAVLGANNQLASWLNKRMYDPQTGALTVKGKDAAGILDTVSKEFQDQVDSINGSLASETQRAEFNKFAMTRSLTAEHEMRTYIYGEMQAFDKNETQSSIANQNDFAAQNATSTEFVQQALDANVKTAMGFARRQGLGDAEREQLLLNTRTATYNAVLDSLLSQGEDLKAEELFNQAKEAGQLNAVALAKFGDKIDSATTQGAGLREATYIWNNLGPKPGDDESAIDLDAMETAAREQFKNEPKKYDAAVRYLRERKQAVDVSRKEREDNIVGGLWKMVANGATVHQITQTPEYQSATGRVQLQVTDSILNRAAAVEGRAAAVESRAAARESRAWTQEQRADARANKAGRTAYYHYRDDPATLIGMSDSAIWALAGEIGPDNAAQLVTDKRTYINDAGAAHTATMDTDQFNTIANAAGFKVYTEPSKRSSDQSDEITRLRDRVEAGIAASEPGKVRLSREEKGQLMQKIVDQTVYLDQWFGDSQKVGAVVNKDDQAIAYVPIKSIPPSSLTKMMNYLRSNNAAYQRLSDAQIQARAKTAIERAYAATVMGMGRVEEAKRLGEAR
jgi:pentatricopeptide repeat protein